LTLMKYDDEWRIPALLPLSWIYRGIISLRNILYDRELLPIAKVQAQVISVGNLSVGGTGKTPCVAFLAKAFSTEGTRVAIVARGYRRRGEGLCIVSDGNRILAGVQEAGDEPLILARQCRNVPVIVDASKTKAALAARDRFGAELIIVDDGFQHRQLYRDCEVVMLPSAMMRQNPWLLPAGPLREPSKSLRRARFILLTDFSELPTEEQDGVMQRCRALSAAQIIPVSYHVSQLKDSWSGESRPLTSLREAKVLAISGIARPQRFYRHVESLGLILRDRLAFPDHHRYTESDLTELAMTFHRTKADFAITTEKDAVKLEQFGVLKRLPFLTLEICMKPGTALIPAIRAAMPLKKGLEGGLSSPP